MRRLLPLLVLLGCAEPATYDYGLPLSQVAFELVAEDTGVHPSQAVLVDPHNPFADTGVSPEGKWAILAAGYWPATFYAWATVLAEEPSGEAQFYTALAAHQIYARRDCDPYELFYVRGIAIAGYQQVLDAFEGSVTYDGTGTVATPLGPWAYAGIVALGGTPEGWILVEGVDGSVAVVPSGTGEAD